MLRLESSKHLKQKAGMCAIERQAFNLNVERRKGKNCSSKKTNLLDADEHVHGDEGNLH